MLALIHILLALPFLACAYVSWRLLVKKERVAGALVACLALGCFVFHPSVQALADDWLAYPYAKRKEALALEHEIVGKNYAFVVEKLGEPSRVRVESPVVSKTATREITRKLDTYQAMDYYLGPGLYLATRFIVFLDESGNVKSHRVKWEHGEGR